MSISDFPEDWLYRQPRAGQSMQKGRLMGGRRLALRRDLTELIRR